MNIRAVALALCVSTIFCARSAPAAEFSQRYMIVAAERYAAEAGLTMLRSGGSSVDAAIAAQLVLTLVEPQSSGIGGGAYMMVSERGELTAYDGRETAAASATPDMFLDAEGTPRSFRDVGIGGLPVGVPGTMAMLALAHKEHGRLPWARLFHPVIFLAEHGFAVPQRMAAALASRRPEAIQPSLRAMFFHDGVTPLAAGESATNPALAQTMRLLAQAGAETFYKGEIARSIAQAVNEAPVNPVPMTLNDLSAYRALQHEPICGLYRAYRVCGPPPSTSGGTTVLQILGILKNFPSESLRPGTLSSVHLISEVSRLAYADRARWLGDPDFVSVPLSGLLDSDYLRGRALLVDTDQAHPDAEAGMPPMREGMLRDYAPQRPDLSQGTSHLSVIDAQGQAVSLTMSIQASFGAHMAVNGFVLNNELTDFSFIPLEDGRPVANAPGPGKRPLSSMSPMIVFDPDGAFFASLGSPGGRRIIAYVAQGLVNLIDGGLSMEGAAAWPRHTNLNGPTEIESNTLLDPLAPQLRAMGHEVQEHPFDSGLNGILRTARGFEGAADPRRSGVALGD